MTAIDPRVATPCDEPGCEHGMVPDYKAREMVPCRCCEGAGETVEERRVHGDIRALIDELDGIHRDTATRLIRKLFEERQESWDARARLRGVIESQQAEIEQLRRRRAS